MIQGKETTRSGYYPINLARSLLRSWERQQGIYVNYEQAYITMWTGDTVNSWDSYTANLPDDEEPQNEAQVERVRAHLHHLHRASGHAPFANLARLLQDARKPKWIVELAKSQTCEACEANRLGNQ